ncbi:MAG: GatB/YqeY domain-containing protein [Microgenomates group bacterium]
MIAANLQKMIGEAMKAHDEVRLSTLRLLSSAFNYEKIEKKHDLTDEEELAIIRREAKKRKEAIESYTKAGSPDRADSEQKELTVLQEFLPPEMDDSELEKIVEGAISEMGATTMADMGKVIGLVKSKTGGGVDGSKIAELVKGKLG